MPCIKYYVLWTYYLNKFLRMTSEKVIAIIAIKFEATEALQG